MRGEPSLFAQSNLDAQTTPSDVTVHRGELPMRFVCVNDSVPPQTTRFLKQASAASGIEYVEVDARSFDYAPSA